MNQTLDRSKTLVLFDVGNVLLKTDFGSFYEKAVELSGGALTSEEFKQKYRGLEVEFLSGLDTQVYLTKLRKMISPIPDVTDDTLKDVVCCMWREAIQEVVDLKKRVHEAGYSVGIFSNLPRFGHDFGVPEIDREILNTFDPSAPAVFSFDSTCVKSDPGMYQEINKLVAEQGYETVIFIDDNESYVRKGVEEYGWLGIWFPPFADEDEASSPDQKQEPVASENFRIANSVKDLEDALKYFGVDIE